MPATFEPIATTTLGSTSGSITFSSIPSTYTDLILVLRHITTSAMSGVNLQFNGDTGSNYSNTRLGGDGSSAFSDRVTNNTQHRLGTTGGTTPALITLHIFNYAGSTNKTSLAESSADLNGSGLIERNVNLWRNTSAINSLVLAPGGNFASGTTATLYGILKA